MPDELRLPVLAAQDYTQLFEALRDAIPAFSSTWTDFNPSDPGITVLQLLAYVAEATSYRLDQVTPAAYRDFLLQAAGTSQQGLEAALQKAEDDVLRSAQPGKPGRGGKPTPPPALVVGGVRLPADPARLTLLRYLAQTPPGTESLLDLHQQAQAYWGAGDRAVTAADLERLAVQASAVVPDTAANEKVVRAYAEERGEGMEVSLVPGVPLGFNLVPLLKPGDPLPPSDPVARSHYLAPLPLPASPEAEDEGAPAPSGGAAPAPPYPPSPVLAIYRASPKATGIPPADDRLVEAVTAFLEPRRLLGSPLRVTPARLSWYRLELDLAVALLPDRKLLPLGSTDAASRTVTGVATQVVAKLAALVDPRTGGEDGTGWPLERELTAQDVVAAVRAVPGVDPTQPVNVRLEPLSGVAVGEARVGRSTLVRARGLRPGLPRWADLTLWVLTTTQPIAVGQAAPGLSTRLPQGGDE